MFVWTKQSISFQGLSCSCYSEKLSCISTRYLSPKHKKQFRDTVRRENVGTHISAVCFLQLHGKSASGFQHFRPCPQKWPFQRGCRPPRTAAGSQGAALASPGCSSTRTLSSAAVARRWRRRPLIFGWANEDDFIPWLICQTKCNSLNPLVQMLSPSMLRKELYNWSPPFTCALASGQGFWSCATRVAGDLLAEALRGRARK